MTIFGPPDHCAVVRTGNRFVVVLRDEIVTGKYIGQKHLGIESNYSGRIGDYRFARAVEREIPFVDKSLERLLENRRLKTVRERIGGDEKIFFCSTHLYQPGEVMPVPFLANYDCND